MDLGRHGKTIVDDINANIADLRFLPGRLKAVLGVNPAKQASNTIDAQRDIRSFFATALMLGEGDLSEMAKALNAEGLTRGQGEGESETANALTPTEILHANYRQRGPGRPKGARQN